MWQLRYIPIALSRTDITSARPHTHPSHGGYLLNNEAIGLNGWFFFDVGNPLHLGKWPNWTVIFSRWVGSKPPTQEDSWKSYLGKIDVFFVDFCCWLQSNLTTSCIFFEWNIWNLKCRPFAKKNHLPKLHQTFWAHDLWSSFVFFVRNAVQGSQESGQAHHQEAQGRDETTWASPSSARVGRGNREWTDPSAWRNTPGRFGIPTSTFRCFQAAV